MTGRPTWLSCHVAGMTAREAATEMGLSRQAATRWSLRRGVRWAGRPTPKRDALVAALPALIAEGLWLREAARRLDVDVTQVVRAARFAGVTFPSAPPSAWKVAPPPPPPPPPAVPYEERVSRLLASGVALPRVGERRTARPCPATSRLSPADALMAAAYARERAARGLTDAGRARLAGPEGRG